MSQQTERSKRTIVVTGATGRQGGAVARNLRRRGYPVRAITRDPNKPNARALLGEGVEVLRADFDDAASLGKALDGAYGVYSVQQPLDAGYEGEVRQGKELVDAAQRQGISHFIYSSVAGADLNTGVPFFETKMRVEEYLRGRGLMYTIVRPVSFMENWLEAAPAIAGGALAMPMSPMTTFYQVAVDDIGKLVAEAFERSAIFRSRAVELAGDARGMADIAAVFSRALNREVKYHQVPWEEFEARMGADLARMFRWIDTHNFRLDIAAIRNEFPFLTTFERWVQEHKDRFAARGGAQRA